MKLKDNKRVIETIKDIAEVIPLTKGKKLTAAQLLETFFIPETHALQFSGEVKWWGKKKTLLVDHFNEES